MWSLFNGNKSFSVTKLLSTATSRRHTIYCADYGDYKTDGASSENDVYPLDWQQISVPHPTASDCDAKKSYPRGLERSRFFSGNFSLSVQCPHDDVDPPLKVLKDCFRLLEFHRPSRLVAICTETHVKSSTIGTECRESYSVQAKGPLRTPERLRLKIDTGLPR